MIVQLNYHRRHGKECKAGYPQNSFTSEPEERRKGWKKCDCPIVASGSLDRVAKRVATKQRDWAAAAAMMAPYIAANSWQETWVAPPPMPPAPSAESPKKKALMSDAAKAFLKAHEDVQSSRNTIDGHQTRMALTLDFCQRKGIVRVDQWTTELVKEFLGEVTVAISTGRTYQSAIKAFFNWSIAEEWVAMKNPAKYKPSIRNLATTKTSGQKFPFSDAELDRMFAACDKYDSFVVSRKSGKLVPGRRNAPRKFKGKDLAEFIAVSAWTGMRISNVAKFNISQLKDNDEVHIRTVKGDVPVYTAVPDWLGEIIRTRAAQFGPFIFGEHSSTRIKTITGEWRERLRVLWRLCGPWEVKPTPHRFRHTFARILLQKGESPADVAQLLGNTEAIVIEHYAAWVRERQERLSALLRKAFADVPNPMVPRQSGKTKVLSIKHG